MVGLKDKISEDIRRKMTESAYRKIQEAEIVMDITSPSEKELLAYSEIKNFLKNRIKEYQAMR